MGPPWSQSVDMGSLVRDGDGVGGWFDFGFKADASSCYPQLRALRKNGLFWGYALLFGGSDGAPRGPRVLIWGPWYRMGMG